MRGSLSFRVGAILLVGFVLLQLVMVIALQIPGRIDNRGSFGLPSPAALAQLVASVEAAGPQGARLLVDSYNGSLFTVALAAAPPTDYREVPASMAALAAGYRGALADHNVVVDGGAGWLTRLLGDRARPLRFLVPIRVTVWLRDGQVLVISGHPADGLRAFLARRNLLGLIGGLVVLVALWLAVRQTTRPLRRLTAGVRAFGEHLAAGDVPVAGSPEIRSLATAFNEMKHRIADLVGERTFILAGIAHDMRTYLTRLRLRTDFIADEVQRARATADLDEMAALLDDGLLVASLHQGPRRRLETVDLTALTGALIADHPDAARITLYEVSPRPVAGDPAGLRRIFANLVDNGLRHGAAVLISLPEEAGGVLWAFDDDGPGVDEAAMPQLGSAFARLDPSRDRRTGGAGLGLAIVRALAGAMGGEVRFARSDEGGLRVAVMLRVSDQSPG